MNKAKSCATVPLTKKAVVIREAMAVFVHLLDEGITLFVVVMQMYFDVANTEANDFRDSVENIPSVLLLRIEKAVLWALPSCVSWSVVGNSWPQVAPTADAAERQFNACTHSQRFIVIGDNNPRAFRPA